MDFRNLGIFFLVSVAGCSSVAGPKYNAAPALVAPDKATIVVYRWSSIKGMAWSHHIYVDGQHVADLGSGNFTRFAVNPGEHHISSGPKASSLSVDLTTTAGTTYFVEDHPGANLYTPDRFYGVDPSVGEKRVRGYAYQAPLVVTP